MRTFWILALTFLLSGASIASAADMEITIPRQGLSNVFQKLSLGKKTVIAYFGGSITAGAGASQPKFCYRELLTAYLKDQFPKADIEEANAAIGGTGSWLGAFRTKADVLSHQPDLVLIEFAVNDGGAPEAQVYASMEGIVRQIRAASAKTDMLFVYTLAKNSLDDFKAGKMPDRMMWHEKIAEKYGIPSVNMALYAAQKIMAGDLTFDDFTKDGVHPTDRGYALYLESLAPFMQSCKADAEKRFRLQPRAYRMPARLSPQPLEKGQLAPYGKAKADENWKPDDKSPVGQFASVLASDSPGATLSLDFTGDCVGIYDALGPDTGDIEISVDDGEWKTLHNFDQWAKDYYRAHYMVLAEGLDATKPHVLKLRVAAEKPADSKGRFTRIGYFLVNGVAGSTASGTPASSPATTGTPAADSTPSGSSTPK